MARGEVPAPITGASPKNAKWGWEGKGETTGTTHGNEQFAQDDLAKAKGDRATRNTEQKPGELFAVLHREAFPARGQKMQGGGWMQWVAYQSREILTWAVCAPKNCTFGSVYSNRKGTTSPQASHRRCSSNSSVWRRRWSFGERRCADTGSYDCWISYYKERSVLE